jgi:hypothetical protein
MSPKEWCDPRRPERERSRPARALRAPAWERDRVVGDDLDGAQTPRGRRRWAARRTAGDDRDASIGSARIALGYWLCGDPLPPASFPSPEETILLLGQGDPKPVATDASLRTWLAEVKLRQRGPARAEAAASSAGLAELPHQGPASRCTARAA